MEHMNALSYMTGVKVTASTKEKVLQLLNLRLIFTHALRRAKPFGMSPNLDQFEPTNKYVKFIKLFK